MCVSLYLIFFKHGAAERCSAGSFSETSARPTPPGRCRWPGKVGGGGQAAARGALAGHHRGPGAAGLPGPRGGQRPGLRGGGGRAAMRGLDRAGRIGRQAPHPRPAAEGGCSSGAGGAAEGKGGVGGAAHTLQSHRDRAVFGHGATLVEASGAGALPCPGPAGWLFCLFAKRVHLVS